MKDFLKTVAAGMGAFMAVAAWLLRATVRFLLTVGLGGLLWGCIVYGLSWLEQSIFHMYSHGYTFTQSYCIGVFVMVCIMVCRTIISNSKN